VVVQLAVANLDDVDALGRHVLAGRRHAHELALMRARVAGPDDDLVTLAQHVEDLHPPVRERLQHHRERRLGGGRTLCRHPGQRRVIDPLGGDELVGRVEVAAAHLLHEPTNDGLVLLRHLPLLLARLRGEL
jgi:hypothetical protein